MSNKVSEEKAKLVTSILKFYYEEVCRVEIENLRRYIVGLITKYYGVDQEVLEKIGESENYINTGKIRVLPNQIPQIDNIRKFINHIEDTYWVYEDNPFKIIIMPSENRYTTFQKFFGEKITEEEKEGIIERCKKVKERVKGEGGSELEEWRMLKMSISELKSHFPTYFEKYPETYEDKIKEYLEYLENLL